MNNPLKLLIISGRSGSGKSTVLHILEDSDYYCIDNLPASLLPSLAKKLANDAGGLSKIAVSIDARNIATDLEQVPDIISGLQENKLQTEVIFLDANSQMLLNRYSESRRKHPLSSDTVSLMEAINIESGLLEPIAAMANLTLDTSSMSIQELGQLVKTCIIEKNECGLALSFLSFGYKNGIPIEADLVFDVRCLPNPYWDKSLRNFNGKDPEVREFLEDHQDVQEMIADIQHFLQKWLKCFEDNNRSYMTIAIGCTGGQHRSVFIAERLAKLFSERYKNLQIRHRELSD